MVLIGLKALNRSANVRIGGKLLSTESTTFVDVSDPAVIRDMARHSSLGQFFVVQARQTVFASVEQPVELWPGDIWFELDEDSQLVGVWVNE